MVVRAKKYHSKLSPFSSLSHKTGDKIALPSSLEFVINSMCHVNLELRASLMNLLDVSRKVETHAPLYCLAAAGLYFNSEQLKQHLEMLRWLWDLRGVFRHLRLIN